MGVLSKFVRRSLDPFNVTGINKKASDSEISARQKTVEDYRSAVEEKAREANIAREADLAQQAASYTGGPVPGAVETIQRDLTERHQGLRAGRDEAVTRRAQPGLQRLSTQAGLKERQIAQGPMGSLSMAERGGVMADKALGGQAVQAQALGEQLQTEQGVQQLETEFTSFFNELAANRFSRELSGLSEEMNEYLSAQGAKIGYDQLAAEARRSTMEMYGRFAASLGQEIDRSNRTDDFTIG